MRNPFTRRKLMQSAAGLSLRARAESIIGADLQAADASPKLCLEIGGGALDAGMFDDEGMRRAKQLGVDYVAMAGPRIPWQETEIRGRGERLKSGGLMLFNMMISGFPNTLYGRPGRDEEIDKVCQSVRAAGRAGLPIIEYNFYAHRLVEGYYEEKGRGGAGLTAF